MDLRVGCQETDERLLFVLLICLLLHVLTDEAGAARTIDPRHRVVHKNELVDLSGRVFSPISYHIESLLSIVGAVRLQVKLLEEGSYSGDVKAAIVDYQD